VTAGRSVAIVAGVAEDCAEATGTTPPAMRSAAQTKGNRKSHREQPATP
jgi:hypothetical protein